MNKYTTVKWEKLLLWLIPPVLRKQTHYHWLNVLLSPIAKIYEETLYKMQHTGQIIYLEKVLNETFNVTKNYNPNLSMEQKRREEFIYIDESVKPTIQYVYLNKEYYEPDKVLSTPTLKIFKLSIPLLKIFDRNGYKKRNNKPVYLAHRSDYTKISYANFRVFIPESLLKNGTIVCEANRDASPHKTEPIKVATMAYHNLLNFYRLAGKSYESYSYEPEK
ncbi:MULTISPECIES: hypothetical protein [Flavobacterium]|jgi:hypothetical protein|uniref:Uncharacterized protein n=1 Tax=Flavobacterium cupriresistens TaxID=2893885 RepID=A0ABU4RIP1_9FLAO|nr:MULTISPECIES: hypothetical protein [unclassified Flavobacterium]KLT68365.1 hypothetical protein AB674_18195 [Flavobacterium sp. ABG]MDX6191280.1 hypothetical protein [Flavobacterium sp. Fl-318]UFH42402.1 hypothetical protein LNP23_21665 [Flavobacterium sp. F-323]